MTAQESYAYIFQPVPELGDGIRWAWVDPCLLGDIQTFIDGMRLAYPQRAALQAEDGIERGAGFFALPIPICTAVDLLSDLYVGDNQDLLPPNSRPRRRCNHTEAAYEFIRDCFPDTLARQYPAVLWRVIRHGLTHLFQPSVFRWGHHGRNTTAVALGLGFASFARVVQPTSGGAGTALDIQLDVQELYHVLRQAVDGYRGRLQASHRLRQRFVRVWRAIERGQWEGRPGPKKGKAKKGKAKAGKGAAQQSPLLNELRGLASLCASQGHVLLFQ